MTEATDSMHEGALSTQPPGVRLIVEEPDTPPRLAFLLAGQRMRVGRSAELELVLADHNVSRCHAELAFDGSTATVEDLGSRNGTWLEDKPVSRRTEILTGDVVRVGGPRIAVVLISTAGRDEAPSDEAAPLGLAEGVVARDPASVAAFRLLVRLARSRLSVLLQGETGSGKEVAAREVHRHSARASGPFVAVNCATLTETLAESELFGHERGAFTGAVARRVGAFEAAQGGTLFLDEVGELSVSNQARLLRALQERTVVRLGSTTPISVDVRVVAATNRDMLDDIRAGRFREDLYFRLNGATVKLPPLRARPHDIAAIAEQVLQQLDGVRLGPGVEDALRRYPWPGNVRELRHAIEHGLALGDGRVVTLDDLPDALRASRLDVAEAPARTLQGNIDATERETILAALQEHHWNQTHAARALGVTRRALIYRMERLGLKAKPPSEAD